MQSVEPTVAGIGARPRNWGPLEPGIGPLTGKPDVRRRPPLMSASEFEPPVGIAQASHQHGLAADYAFVINGKVTCDGPWKTFGNVARQCGLEWGGDWRGTLVDRPHVQVTRGKTLAQMRWLAAQKKGK